MLRDFSCFFYPPTIRWREDTVMLICKSRRENGLVEEFIFILCNQTKTNGTTHKLDKHTLTHTHSYARSPSLQVCKPFIAIGSLQGSGGLQPRTQQEITLSEKYYNYQVIITHNYCTRLWRPPVRFMCVCVCQYMFISMC